MQSINQKNNFIVPESEEDHPGRPKQNLADKSELEYIKLIKKKIPKPMNFMID